MCKSERGLPTEIKTFGPRLPRSDFCISPLKIFPQQNNMYKFFNNGALLLDGGSRGRPLYLVGAMRRFVGVFFLSLCLLLSFGGCGYSFQGGESVLPPGVEKLYIPDVINRSSDPSITGLLTEALRERFERFGVVRVVEEARDADATLKVKVLQVLSSSQTSSARTDVSQELNLSILLAGELTQKNGVILWKNPVIKGSQAYGNLAGAVVSSSAQFAQSGLGAGDLEALNQRELSRSQQQQALEGLVEEVARQIYEEAVAPDF